MWDWAATIELQLSWNSDLRWLLLTLDTWPGQTSGLLTALTLGLGAMHRPMSALALLLTLAYLCSDLYYSAPSALRHLNVAEFVGGILYIIHTWNPRKFAHLLRPFCATGQKSLTGSHLLLHHANGPFWLISFLISDSCGHSCLSLKPCQVKDGNLIQLNKYLLSAY